MIPPADVQPAPGCAKTYTVPMVRRAIDATFRGTRDVSAVDVRHLRHFIACARNPRDRGGERARWVRARRAWWHRRGPFTGYVVSGTVSTFGPPLEGPSQTADGGSDNRPCIALQDASTLGRWFRVTIQGHAADLLHCDSGPYANGRSIDVTGAGAYAMGLNPYSFPTDSNGTAQELR